MNPLHWKREHQWALGLAVALGAFVVALIAYRTINVGMCRSYLYGLNLACVFRYWWGTILFWPFAGALIGGAVVYIRQLLRQ